MRIDKGVKLSKRMEAVSALVTTGNRLADVGTDHGYLPIALVQKNVVASAVAMDIRTGPLERARGNIREAGLECRIETRLCDGVSGLLPGEADTVVIAGMGGDLVIHILTEGEKVCRMAEELVLQPQSRIEKVRLFLQEKGYRITHENMVYEDGKFYPMMRAVPVPNGEEIMDSTGRMTEAELLYGPLLLRDKNSVLREFLYQERRQLRQVRSRLVMAEDFRGAQGHANPTHQEKVIQPQSTVNPTDQTERMCVQNDHVDQSEQEKKIRPQGLMGDSRSKCGLRKREALSRREERLLELNHAIEINERAAQMIDGKM